MLWIFVVTVRLQCRHFLHPFYWTIPVVSTMGLYSIPTCADPAIFLRGGEMGEGGPPITMQYEPGLCSVLPIQTNPISTFLPKFHQGSGPLVPASGSAHDLGRMIIPAQEVPGISKILTIK